MSKENTKKKTSSWRLRCSGNSQVCWRQAWTFTTQPVPRSSWHRTLQEGEEGECSCVSVWTCGNEKNQGWCKTQDGRQAGETEIQQIHTAECKRERRKEKRGGGDKKTFKGVNSRRVTILGVESIPSWHSPDKSALMLLIRRGEKKKKMEGGRSKGECWEERTESGHRDYRVHRYKWRCCRGLQRCEAGWSKDRALMCNWTDNLRNYLLNL